ncbi:MAG: DUF362 domain-containing protein [Caldithrix sp.]|nr:DUF362 domain-containing protein [Caldithrix sp.]
MKRRQFLKSSLWATTTMPFIPLFGRPHLKASDSSASKIILADNAGYANGENTVNSYRIAKRLDEAIAAYFDAGDPLQGWKQVVRPSETIGLKVNCLSARGVTHPELVEAIIERLQQSGIRTDDIIIWDRLSSDLEDGGFTINYKQRGVKCYGNDYLGFNAGLQVFGSAGSRVCRTLTDRCDGIINLPLLKDHSIAGVTISLKNMFGAIHNPHKYHLNSGDPYIADVNSFKPIRQKIRLNIVDALDAQYEGGPSFLPHWRWPCNTLLVGQDQVALDYTGWQIIEHKRAEQQRPSLKEAGRQPSYIFTAADRKHQLGCADPQNIKPIHI